MILVTLTATERISQRRELKMFDATNMAPQSSAGLQGNLPIQYIPPTKRQKLLQLKGVLEGQLAKVTSALAALDAHPELEQFVDTLEKAGI